MLLSDWYAKWKAQRIQEAIEEAQSKQVREEGYADGKLGTPNLKGINSDFEGGIRKLSLVEEVKVMFRNHDLEKVKIASPIPYRN